jgi:hypothetical protein
VHPGDHPLAGIGLGSLGLLRCSRGAGLPRGLPDIWGLAIRFCGVGADADVDVLLATAWRSFVPRPVLERGSSAYSSITRYRDGDRTIWLAATLHDRPLPVVDLITCEREGRRLAVTLAARTALDDADAPRFEPDCALGALRPDRWLSRLRAPAYRGSRRGSERPRSRVTGMLGG